MRLTLEKYAPLTFLMGLALLISLSVISYRSLNDLTQTADQVTTAARHDVEYLIGFAYDWFE
jgi:CHASE3 domain sensor protein